MSSSAPAANGGRLNGWKEIAAHLGKGTRTAQRWEKEYGLPVHRVGREGGEIVFAFRDEIDRWSRQATDEGLREVDGAAATEATSAAPGAVSPLPAGTRTRLASLWIILAGAGGLALLFALSLGLARPDAGRAPLAGPPAGWRLANGVLTVLDAGGRQVFSHDFGVATLSPASSADVPHPRHPIARIVDVDGDGRSEVLVRLSGARREDRAFYCFDADGRVRFVDRPRGSVRFGDTEYAEPWLAHRHFVTGAVGSRSLFVAFTHNLWFPTRLRRLDGRGGLSSEYWSNGFVEFVDEAVWRGRPVVLVGGAGNDVRGASLSIFDRDTVRGHAPSSTASHACRGCPEGGPVERLTFPSPCLLRRGGGLASVLEAWVEAGDRLTVMVQAGPAGLWKGGGEIAVFYTFGPDLSLVHAELSPEFQAVHSDLEKQGALGHRFGATDEADMFPVLRFGANGFRALPAVRVTR
jgi:hypothetical protein